ncbi:hypothetical protein BN946_scf184866.g27 [Trametes cinnabarina]|uniref:Uncharacterized protein n=1 Tax=Pycnoporus cinnabarinus TaxID=5643 RepID=A0A060SLX5_PYCCI|nr:hypothetical protein BN946_scf184866.g27 [Trametes cinnabarina]
MSSNENNVPHSLPIPIGGSRRRSGSVSEGSSSDSGSTSPASPLQTPASGPLPRIAPITPSTSPILSYFLSQSPKSPPSATFPFRRGMAPPVYEDDEMYEAEKPAPRHGRSVSTAWPTTDRFPVSPTAAMSVPGQQDRASGLLRRLSLGGNMTRPQLPPQKPVNNGTREAPRSTTPPGMSSNPAGALSTPTRKARRANTMAPGTARPPRAPSPMGERILKGHFDGFN